MEFLRRFRIFWAAAFAIIAALVGLAYMGNPTGVPLSWFFAALVAAVSFNIQGSVKLKLSVLWLGGFGLLFYGAFMTAALTPDDTAKAFVRTLALTVGPWFIAAVSSWLFNGLFKPKH